VVVCAVSETNYSLVYTTIQLKTKTKSQKYADEGKGKSIISDCWEQL
jgi:hypothetical protein